MKREDLARIIKVRSFFKIDKRRGDYKLPSGAWLSAYLTVLTRQQLELDSLGFASKYGDLYPIVENVVMIPYGANVETSKEEQEKYIWLFVREMLGY